MVETRLQRQQQEQARSTAYSLRDLPGRPAKTQQSIKVLAGNASSGRGRRGTSIGRGRGPRLQEQLGRVPVLTRATGVDDSPTQELGVPTTVARCAQPNVSVPRPPSSPCTRSMTRNEPTTINEEATTSDHPVALLPGQQAGADLTEENVPSPEAVARPYSDAVATRRRHPGRLSSATFEGCTPDKVRLLHCTHCDWVKPLPEILWDEPGLVYNGIYVCYLSSLASSRMKNNSCYKRMRVHIEGHDDKGARPAFWGTRRRFHDHEDEVL